MTVLVWSGVAVLGGAGALARFRLDAFVEARVGGAFPFGTLVVNLFGVLVLGLLTGLGITGDALLVLGTGFTGSFTTFSTWMLETERLGGRLGLANLVVPLGGGFAVAALGWAIGAALR